MHGSSTLEERLQALSKASKAQEAVLLTVLQHVHDGVQEVVMAQPTDPFLYMASYLQHTMTLQVEPEDVVLAKELHKKQIQLGKLRLEMLQLRRSRVRALVKCLEIEAELGIEPSETVVTADDHEFLKPERQLDQTDWCPTAQDLMDVPSTPSVHLAIAGSRNINASLEYFLPEVVDALVELQKYRPEDPLHWLVDHFRSKSSQTLAHVASLKLTLGQYRLYLDEIRDQVPTATEETHRASDNEKSLQAQLDERNRLIRHLSVTNAAKRSETSIRGRQIVVNFEKLWIPIDSIEPIAKFTPFQLQALHRAEIFLMRADEVAYKAKLQFDLEYASSTKIQAMYKCHVMYTRHQVVMAARHRAASQIQAVYERYLYLKAIRLPSWCVVGQQVVVALSIARRAAITFQFYPGKDFTAGNFTTLAPPVDIERLKQRCRHDEQCAAFASDGSLKRFVPRQLSQLQPMKRAAEVSPLDGLYIKQIPRDDAKVITHAIVEAIPPNKFGMLQVVFDGTGVVEDVPVQKLSLRWKRTYDFTADEWFYVDEITKRRAAKPPAAYTDDQERHDEIALRKRIYAMEQDEEYQRKRIRSAIKLQCAFRNRKARKLFRFMLAVREKEKEHAAQVEQVAQQVAKKREKRRRWWFR
ncbi:hypothetical protein LEN26_008494 [Aphanomyces euteiches]|nr:hypothetical protein AeMF1_005354 [Aphanomyces euteiches]KAH9130467.1 hypothetical protein LEN26_008494 [Aphanomyces euteiches]KAH9187266.1 hypothetical protein AeNC1_010757 [Aphanomyces euteiches]